MTEQIQHLRQGADQWLPDGEMAIERVAPDKGLTKRVERLERDGLGLREAHQKERRKRGGLGLAVAA